MAIINPTWINKQTGSFQTADEMNNLAAAIKNNAVELEINVINTNSKVDKTTTINTKHLSGNIVLDKTDIGLNNVDNTSDLNKPISSSTQLALDDKAEKTINVIAGNGIVGGGTIANNVLLNLESANEGIIVNVDNIELDTIDNLTSTNIKKPLSANQGKVLNETKVSKTGNEVIDGQKIFSESPLVPTPVNTGAAVNKAYVLTHINNVNNPHNVTATQVGLGNVNNTADMDKPVSIAVNSALDLKADKLTMITAGQGLNGGGSLATNRTINVVCSDDSVLVAVDSLKVNTVNDLDTLSPTRPLSASQGYNLNNNKANKAITITAGNGLVGGGDLSANRTFSISSENSGILINADSIELDTVNDLITTNSEKPLSANMGKVLNDNKVSKTGNESISGIKSFDDSPQVPYPINADDVTNKEYVDTIKSKQIIAGTGLTGGGDLSADRTLNVVSANDGITVNSDNIQLNAINDLNTTSTTKPLAANQGKILNDTITSLTNLIKYAQQWYGVEWDITISTSSCTRIGNMGLHNTLPIQSKMRRCLLKDDGMVNYYLSNTDSTKKADDVTAAILDGTDGQVMVEIPEFYYKWESDGNKRRILISQYPIFSSKFDRTYVSAYEASLNRINNKLSSVVNTTTDYRGGNNTSTWDVLTSSLLGKPATNISLTNYRTYARNRGSVNWNCNTYNVQKIMYILYLIEYANFNCQLPYNGALDANGYHQGGLSDGVTNIDGTKWNNFNGDNPFIPCGYTNCFGNTTNIILFTMPFEYDSNGSANYIGVFNLSTTYLLNQYVSYNNLLYKCILESTGNPITNTSYFIQITRTVTNVPSYRGIENPFGHVWKRTDGCKCDIQTDANGGNSLFYTCDNPTNYQDTNYLNYKISGLLVRSSGYIKQLISEEIMPSTIGGSSTTYMCDYFYTDVINNTGQRAVYFGGSANGGANTGFGFAGTDRSASTAHALIGSRLCYILI